MLDLGNSFYSLAGTFATGSQPETLDAQFQMCIVLLNAFEKCFTCLVLVVVFYLVHFIKVLNRFIIFPFAPFV